MADVTGPISTLPGHRRDSPDGVMCDNHPDRPAVVRVQGETDSFGCEMCDLCAECAAADRAANANGYFGNCDWCQAKRVELRPRRDYDEGMCGPVYYVCTPCVVEHEKSIQEELDCDGYDDVEEGFDAGEWNNT
jgi:hypothetical protein